MEDLGQIIPSISNISINFRTAENEMEILNKIYAMPQILQYNIDSNKTIKHKIFFEKGAPFIFLNTNLCNRPLKLLVDTGAAVSIIANDIINKDTNKTNYSITLFGIAGSEISVTTKGMVYGILEFDSSLLGTTLHLVERKYAGSGDGYLGFDFLGTYKVKIDLNEMCLNINLENIIKINNEINNETKTMIEKKEIEPIQDKEENIYLEDPLNIPDFMPQNCKRNSNKIMNTLATENYIEYDQAVKFYKNKINEYEDSTIFPITLKINYLNAPDRSIKIFEQLNLKNCTSEERKFIKTICLEFPLHFFLNGDPIGATHVLKHHIHLLPNAKIVNIKQYRIPHAHKIKMEEIIKEYENNGIIEKCSSPYNSPAILVKKKDDTGEKMTFD